MPLVTSYIFFLVLTILNNLFYKSSLVKPFLSFVVISVLFFTYFYLQYLDYSVSGIPINGVLSFRID